MFLCGLLYRGMTRWGEYVDLHQIDEMAETPQETVVTTPLPGSFFLSFPFLYKDFKTVIAQLNVSTTVGHQIWENLFLIECC